MNYRESLRNNLDKVEEILAKLGFSNITYKGKGFRFSYDDTSSENRFAFCLDRLKYYDFRDGESGDIIDLIKMKLDYGTYKAASWLQLVIGSRISLEGKVDNVVRTLNRKLEDMGLDPEELIVYNDSILETYHNGYYDLFLNDGVGMYAHIVFDVRLNEETNRILIPVRNENGELVGIIGRYNSKELPKKMPKYLPEIPYPKKKVVYGVWENKDYLSDTVYVVESEKTVLQAFSMGYRNVVAVGGSRVSDEQLSIIRSLGAKRIILLLDKGLAGETHYVEQAKKLISPNPFIKYLVGYLESNEVDSLPDKANPFDMTKEVCKKILRDKITYIGGL